MKKIISSILCIVLIASTFTACSFSKPSFSKIEAELCLENCSNYQMCLKDNLLFVTSERVFYDYDDSDKPDEYEAEFEKVDNRFTLYDIEKDEIICQKDKETKEPLSIFDVLFEGEDKIVVMQDDKKVYYDYNLNELETKEYDYYADNSRAIGESDFGDDINCTVDGVYQEYSKNFESFIFKEEPNSVYIIDKDKNSEYAICGGKKIISQESTFNEDRNVLLSTTIKVMDFDDKEILNSYTFNYEQDNNICNVRIDGAINDNFAVIEKTTDRIINDNGDCESSLEYYVWNYNENSKPETFKVDKYDYDDLNDMAKNLSNDISERYNIFVNFNVDTVPCYYDGLESEDMYYIDFKIKDVVTLYDNLIDADNIFSNFPEGMLSRLDNFSLYIVNSITGCAAYANTSVDEVTGEIMYFIVSGYSSISSLPHELMHCFDSYILNNLDDAPLSKPYMALNPVNIFDESFYNDHTEEDKLNYVYNGSNKDVSAFVSDYATTNILEDKAELFQLLYNIGTDYDVYKDDGMEKLSAPAIRKKAELICKVLREAFPEIKDTPVWERALNE